MFKIKVSGTASSPEGTAYAPSKFRDLRQAEVQYPEDYFLRITPEK